MKDDQIRAYLREIAQRGGKARAKNLTSQERSASAKKAAQVRWEEYRKKAGRNQ